MKIEFGQGLLWPVVIVVVFSVEHRIVFFTEMSDYEADYETLQVLCVDSKGYYGQVKTEPW